LVPIRRARNGQRLQTSCGAISPGHRAPHQVGQGWRWWYLEIEQVDSAVAGQVDVDVDLLSGGAPLLLPLMENAVHIATPGRHH
jgi:hypothetical protein